MACSSDMALEYKRCITWYAILNWYNHANTNNFLYSMYGWFMTLAPWLLPPNLCLSNIVRLGHVIQIIGNDTTLP